MSSSVPQKGIIAALWIPADQEGEVLRDDLARNLEFLKQAGIHGVLALGSTGEFPQFSVEQRKRVLSAVAEFAAPLPVIANISDIRPRAVAELGRHARQIGLSAVAIMPPGFFPSSPDDLLAHFLHAAEASGLPTFLYNFPELAGSRIGIEIVAKFAERAPMAGIKQSGSEFVYLDDLIRVGREKNFVVFSATDTRVPEALKLGAVGCIAGMVNIVPELMLKVYRIGAGEENGDPTPYVDQLKRIRASIERLSFPRSVAAGMAARGFAIGAPKAVISPRSQEVFQSVTTELRAQFEQWGMLSAGKV